MNLRRRLQEEEGVALLIAVILLLMVSAIGLTALQTAQDESSGSGRSRRKTMTLYAADAALEVVEDRLNTTASLYPNAAPYQNNTFMTDQWGGTTAVRTGNTESAVAQAVVDLGETCDGCPLNVNAGNKIVYHLYRTGVVATDRSGGVVEVQAQYQVRLGSSSYK